MRSFRKKPLLLAILLCLGLGACTPKGQLAGGSSILPPPPAQHLTVTNPPLLAQGTAPQGSHVPSGQWLVRQKMELHVPGFDLQQAFDGVAVVDFQNRTAHIAGLGGMGLTLFTATITPQAATIQSLHPTLGKLPHVQEQILHSATALLFYSLGPALAVEHSTALHSKRAPMAQALLPATANGTTKWLWQENRLHSVLHYAPAASISGSSLPPSPAWVILVSPTLPPAGAPAFTFINSQPAYSLTMRVVHTQQKVQP